MAELNSKFPGGYVPSRRFGLVQGAKVCAVGDFSKFLVNVDCGTGEKKCFTRLGRCCIGGQIHEGRSWRRWNILAPSAEESMFVTACFMLAGPRAS